MSRSTPRALHWFRNDLRLRDNEALRQAAAQRGGLALVFVLDPFLLASPRMGAPRVGFLLDALDALDRDLHRRGQHLHVIEGVPEEVLPRLAADAGIDRVTWSEDTSPYARRRDERVRALLEERGVEVVTALDRCLVEPGSLRTGKGTPYTVFSPFRDAFWKHWDAVERPSFGAPRLPAPVPGLDPRPPPELATLGFEGAGVELPGAGERAARRRLRAFVSEGLAGYATDRDRMDLDGTSRLSPYLRFGMLSPRQCVEAARAAADDDPRRAEGARKWCDELVWREFYASILAAFPRVLEGNFRRDLGGLRWSRSQKTFEAWQQGRTGYPIVDAGMRQLRATGWMHNRARMVVASFLTKDLWIDWRRGERHFEHWLVDADPASNNGGWQWSASTGTDAQPYFRIFNPLSQARRFDPHGDYVRRWVPELCDIAGADVHEPGRRAPRPADYPAPIVDHASARSEALARFERAKGRRPA
ncbi:MAG: cryptochrome/photolyase family protein [Myxococcota bacterium]